MEIASFSNGERLIAPVKNKVDSSCYTEVLGELALNFPNVYKFF